MLGFPCDDDAIHVQVGEDREVKGQEEMGGEGQILKRIPRIKFPQRHSKSPSASGLSLSLFFLVFFFVHFSVLLLLTFICTTFFDILVL